MKQMLQNLKSGKISVADVPRPLLMPGGIIVRTRKSLISAGTERMVLQLGKKSLLGKARERPDLVRKVLDKVRRDGILATFKSVRDKLDSDVPLGYSNCGEVLEVGDRARRFQVGQRVACAGAKYANHAEVNYIPRLLAVPVPEGVADEAAAYATVGTIALQGVRLADLRVGETAGVLGLGLIGQLTVQILRASGCRVAAIDLAPDRVDLAAAHGAELALRLEGDVTERQVLDFTRGRGADAILITAATSSNEPVEQAARLARDRARVIMVGVTGMNIPRAPYFQKELTFMVSRSYGPGRYDPEYEEHGHDYPVGHVRWTENRNIEAFLDMVAAGTVRPEVLTTHRYPIAEAEKAFELILRNEEPYLGVVLDYPEAPGGPSAAATTRIELPRAVTRTPKEAVGISFVGAGGFAKSTLMPTLARLGCVSMRGVVTASGMSARSAGAKFGFAYCTSQLEEILRDEQTDVVFVATRPDQHADPICQALAAGKVVFTEKPLAVSMEQLSAVLRALRSSSAALMVGFNRRFAPLAVELKAHVTGRGPLTAHYRCNVGQPDPEAKHVILGEGGLLIGEACHFLDFFSFLTDSPAETVYAACPGREVDVNDAQVIVRHADGSVCSLLYTTRGTPAFGKERVEVFSGGNIAVLEDYRRLELVRSGGGSRRRRALRADKGHRAELEAFLASVRRAEPMPISIDSLVDTTLASFAVVESLRRGEPVTLSELKELLTASCSKDPSRPSSPRESGQE